MVILIADDEDADVALFSSAIGRLGKDYTVQSVRNGEEALAYIQGRSEFADRSLHPFPDFFFLDLNMPRRTGFEVLEWLRAHPEKLIVPTIIFTASGAERDIERAYSLGANSYFMKPSKFSQLVEVLRTIFSYWEQAKHLKLAEPKPKSFECSGGEVTLR